MDSLKINELFTSHPNESDDYYAILGCDELSSVSIMLHIFVFYFLFYSL